MGLKNIKSIPGRKIKNQDIDQSDISVIQDMGTYRLIILKNGMKIKTSDTKAIIKQGMP